MEIRALTHYQRSRGNRVVGTAAAFACAMLSSGCFSNNTLQSSSPQGAAVSDSNTVFRQDGDTGLYAKDLLSIHRLQCRDTPIVRHPLDSQIYDPIQSEDPALIYPLNFYAGNRAVAFEHFAANPRALPNSAGAGWICPQSGADPAHFSTAGFASMQDMLSATVDPVLRVDYRIYRGAAETSGNISSKLVYPPRPGLFDSARFVLSRKPTGAYSVPINAIVAPNTLSAQSSGKPPLGTPPPIGYGVAPQNSTCTGNPPSGHRWAKLWLMRAALPVRQAVQSSKIALAGEITCNPGFRPGTSTPIFSDCGSEASITGGTAAKPLAPRVLKMNSDSGNDLAVCVKLSDLQNPRRDSGGNNFYPDFIERAFCTDTSPAGVGAGCTTLPNGSAQRSASLNSFAKGTDVWAIVRGNTSIPCGGSPNDPLGLCLPPNNNTANPPLPRDTTAQSVDIDPQSRFDYLFVVTPDSYAANDVRNSPKYQIYRFYQPGSCMYLDPDAQSSNPECTSDKRIYYSLVVDDPLDPVASKNSFPVCVLQKVGE